MKRAAVMVVAVLALSCGGAPEAGPTPSTVAAPVALPTPAPIPIPGTIPAPPRTLTLFGAITDGLDSLPLSLVTVKVNDATLATTDGQGRYSVTTALSSRDQFSLEFSRGGFITQRTYYVPVNLNDTTRIDWMLPRECASNMNVGQLRVIVQRDYVDFLWEATFPYFNFTTPRDYLLEVGRIPLQLSDFTFPNVFSTLTGGAARYRWDTPSSGPGHYWARVRGRNDCGLGAAPYPTFFDLP
jgi:hypothetical protein